MKQLPIALCLSLFLVSLTAEAQRLREKDLVGTSWKMHIDIEQALEEAEEEMEEEDNILGEMILRGVSGVVEGIIENIDIYFDFYDNNEVRVYVDAFGAEETDTPTGKSIAAGSWSLKRPTTSIQTGPATGSLMMVFLSLRTATTTMKTRKSTLSR